MIARRRNPEEFHGLSAGEAAEMIASGLERAEWDKSRLKVAHGDLCAALIHLRRAHTYFSGRHEVAFELDRLARELDPLIPSYIDFSERFPKRWRKEQ